MTVDNIQLENLLFDFLDQIKVLLAQETWDNILMNCTKNEMLILLNLYRASDVNMTQLAENLNVPLNTATGIVARMEKKAMVLRVRRADDKRVVTIVLTDEGRQQIQDIMTAFMVYGQKILTELTSDELSLLLRIIDKVIHLLKTVKSKEDAPLHKVRKIIID